MSEMKFSFSNPNKFLSEVTDKLRAEGKRISRVPARAVRRGTFALLALIQKHTPKKTSTLVRSLTADVREIGPDLVEGRVGSAVKYARAVEEGTGVYGPQHRPITIMAKKRKALFWGAFDEKTGKPLFRRQTIVQGMKPRGMFAKGTADFVPKYTGIIEQELAKGEQS